MGKKTRNGLARMLDPAVTKAFRAVPEPGLQTKKGRLKNVDRRLQSPVVKERTPLDPVVAKLEQRHSEYAATRVGMLARLESEANAAANKLRPSRAAPLRPYVPRAPKK
jgi:hypothetical protein